MDSYLFIEMVPTHICMFSLCNNQNLFKCGCPHSYNLDVDQKMMNFSTVSIQSYLRDDFPVANYNCAHPDGFIMVYLKWGNPFFPWFIILMVPMKIAMYCHILHMAINWTVPSFLDTPKSMIY